MSDRADEPAPLPVARVVDRGTGYDKAASIGEALFGAVWTMLFEVPACLVLFVLLARIDQHMVPEWTDAIIVALFGLLMWWLVDRIVRAREIETKARSTTVHHPSTSWAHAVFDVLYATAGAITLPSTSWKQGPQAELDFTLSLSLLTVPLSLLVLRIVFWRRRATRGR